MVVSMMHTAVILDPETCVYDAHIYDAVLFGDGRTNGRTDEQGDSRSLMRHRHICIVDT